MKGPYPIRTDRAQWHLHRTVGYPRLFAFIFIVGGIAAMLLPIAGGLALFSWPIFLAALIAWVRYTHRTGKDVSVSADVVRLGDVIVRRSDLDLLYVTPPVRREPMKLWFLAEKGERLGWFETTAKFADEAMTLLALHRARVSAQRVGVPETTVVEATREGLILREATVTRYRWEDIDAIESRPRGFVIRKRTGGELPFTNLRGHLMGTEVEKELAEAFVERANELKVLLDGRDRREVVARVSAALEGDGAFREMPVERTDLWTVLESNAASVDLRLKAARLLAREGHNHARFRVASEWCAEPKVRVELEKLANQPEVVETSTPTFPEAQKR